MTFRPSVIRAANVAIQVLRSRSCSFCAIGLAPARIHGGEWLSVVWPRLILAVGFPFPNRKPSRFLHVQLGAMAEVVVREQGGEMTQIPDDLLNAVVRCLSESGHPILTASEFVPPDPGLYAIRAKPEVWEILGLEARGPEVPLYVGKSESSLVGRDLKGHFATGPECTPNTGSSTVRRSFAALLREPLGLQGVPRNQRNPERPSNYGLEEGGDLLLTNWMQARLTLVCWPKPPGLGHLLKDVEKAIIKRWDPPINITHAPTNRKALKDARAVMTMDARKWINENAT